MFHKEDSLSVQVGGKVRGILLGLNMSQVVGCKRFLRCFRMHPVNIVRWQVFGLSYFFLATPSKCLTHSILHAYNIKHRATKFITSQMTPFQILVKPFFGYKIPSPSQYRLVSALINSMQKWYFDDSQFKNVVTLDFFFL